jgi:hypothetical protein
MRLTMFYARLMGTILLCALGLWFAISGKAHFKLGGDPDSIYKSNQVVHVDAHGADAVAIGLFAISLGIINLALGVRDRRRIPIFWTGAGLFILTALYGVARFVMDILGV